jgi:hypothetical protein
MDHELPRPEGFAPLPSDEEYKDYLAAEGWAAFFTWFCGVLFFFFLVVLFEHARRPVSVEGWVSTLVVATALGAVAGFTAASLRMHSLDANRTDFNSIPVTIVREIGGEKKKEEESLITEELERRKTVRSLVGRAKRGTGAARHQRR